MSSLSHARVVIERTIVKQAKKIVDSASTLHVFGGTSQAKDHVFTSLEMSGLSHKGLRGILSPLNLTEGLASLTVITSKIL